MFGFGDPLSSYLNDHLAGSTAGLNLARRVAEDLADEIEQDRDALLDVMERLSVSRDRVRVAAGWGAEKLLRYSPLSSLEELEALSLGVEGKLAQWKTLRHTHGDDPRLAGIDFDELAARAQSQRRRLERQRLRAAEEAF
jgi:hypothetical protein